MEFTNCRPRAVQDFVLCASTFKGSRARFRHLGGDIHPNPQTTRRNFKIKLFPPAPSARNKEHVPLNENKNENVAGSAAVAALSDAAERAPDARSAI